MNKKIIIYLFTTFFHLIKSIFYIIKKQKRYCLYDTNFISNLLKGEMSNDSKRQEFSQKIHFEIYKQDTIPLMAFTTLIEISKNADLKEELGNFFNKNSISILNSWDFVAEESLKDNFKKEYIILFEFKADHTFKKFLYSLPFTKEYFDERDKNYKKYMIDLRKIIKQNPNKSNDEIIKQTLKLVTKNLNVNPDEIKKTSSLYLFWLNQIHKIRNSKDEASLNDVNDMMVVPAFLPFIDEVYTDKSQAEFVRQMKNKKLIKKDMKIYRLSDMSIKEVK